VVPPEMAFHADKAGNIIISVASLSAGKRSRSW
jgi:hypothetical protein